MSLPGVTLNVQDGNLGLQPQGNAQSLIFLGCAAAGTSGALTFYGDIGALQDALDTGELVEAAAYSLSVNGGPVGVMKMPITTAGGFSTVTHNGNTVSGGTVTVSAAPHKQIVITLTASGALGTSTFTYQVGTSGAISGAVATPTGGTYQVPGTYSTLTFPSGSYNTGEYYTISTLGTVTYTTGGGGSSQALTQASSPIDWYTPTITITKAGALQTATFTYSLDGTTANASADILTPSTKYAIPNTGSVLTLSGTMVLADTYTFTTAGPRYSNSDLTSAMTALETTYLSSSYAMAAALGNLVSTSDWSTQCSTLETAATTLFNSGVYVRFLNGCPTVGSITASGSTVAVNTASTDSVISTARTGVSAPHVSASAGDCLLTSPVNGLSFRRNALWPVAARAGDVSASENIGAVVDGALTGVTYLYRDEQVTPALDAIGMVTLRSFPGNISSGTGLAGYFITDGHTLSASTSDYYPLTNARVIDLGCTVTRSAALQYINSRIPTTTRNGLVGVITEKKAQIIESSVNGRLSASLVNTEPQEAVASSVTVNRTHNILADGNLILTVAIQPFAYARTITANIGLAVAV